MKEQLNLKEEEIKMKHTYKTSMFFIVATLMMVGCSTEDPESNQSEKIDSTELKESINQNSVQSKEQESNPLDESKDQESKKVETEDNESYSGILDDLKNTKRYTSKIRMISNTNDQETETFVTNVVADDQTYSLIESEYGVTENIEKGNKSYLVMHDSKIIMKANRYEEEDELNPTEDPMLVYDNLEYIGKGQEEFLGNNRPYEEYRLEYGTVKYYFDGKELHGMELTIDMESLFEDDEDYDEEEEPFETGEVTLIMEILSFEKEVDMSVFDLPEDYQVIGE